MKLARGRKSQAERMGAYGGWEVGEKKKKRRLASFGKVRIDKGLRHRWKKSTGRSELPLHAARLKNRENREERRK